VEPGDEVGLTGYGHDEVHYTYWLRLAILSYELAWYTTGQIRVP